MRQIKNIHLVGIGGSGMGGIAEVLHYLGYNVTGSDVTNNAMVMHLKHIGINIMVGHNANNIVDKDVLVVSSAISSDNVELQEAHKLNVPIVQRAAMLSELMRFKQGIAVAGAHGKTTTTSLIANIMAAGDHDPTFVIGGRVHGFGSNARLGSGNYFIVEADESDASFLQLNPLVSVITNIEADHLENYDNDYEKLEKAYLEFIHKLPFYGFVVVCYDDPGVVKLLPEIARPIVTYGLHSDADYRIEFLERKDNQSHFIVHRKNNISMKIVLNLPGRHNILNATAAIAVATEEGISDTAITKGLQNFTGVERRMQNLGTIKVSGGTAVVIDDYGHHPSEIKVVIESVREDFPNNRLVMLFQPHRYSRTKVLFAAFAEHLAQVDELLLLEVYPAGENYLPGADSNALAVAIATSHHNNLQPMVITELSQVTELLQGVLQDGDVLLMQGAGNIGRLATEVVSRDAKIASVRS
ncbi:MAG: UDP-N-acetylmuramate--L-alanine ligase [Legionellales bacterium]|nr:MAG: UDP-N-acetylmuramate--L-alanine ligase [Legionellales bacterium]